MNRGSASVIDNAELRVLIEGNERYVEGKSQAKPLSLVERAALAKGQKPIAIVLTCADSRVIPNYFFDLPEGKLFVCRVAGNVLDGTILGSIEYAAEHLGSGLLIVVGHTNCGAVKAACEAHGEISESIEAIVKKIKPAVESVRKNSGSEKPEVNQVVEENVRNVVVAVKASPGIAKFVKDGFVVKGAVYSLETGRVKFLNQ